MSSPATPCLSAGASDIASAKLNGVKESMVTPSSTTQHLATTTGSKRKASSLASMPVKVARVAPNSAAPELHGKDRGEAVQENGSNTDAETPQIEEPQGRFPRRIHPPKRASRLPTSTDHQSRPDPVEVKDSSGEASEEPASAHTSEPKEKSTGGIEVAPSISDKLEVNLTASVEGAPLPFRDIKEDQIGAVEHAASLSSPAAPRKEFRTKSVLFMKKSKRVQKSIAQRAPQPLYKDRAEVSIIAAEDALEAETVGIVAKTGHRGKQGNAAYFAKAADGLSRSGRLKQTDDGDLKIRRKR